MTRRTAIAVLGAAFIVITPGVPLVAEPQPKAVIMSQPSSPTEIVAYTVDRHWRNYLSAEITHRLKYRNRSPYRITAIRFVLVSFDMFNRFLERTNEVMPYVLPSGDTMDGEWVTQPQSVLFFSTGLAYVDLVRFDDGSIWQADETTVREEIRKIENGVDAALGAPRWRGGPSRHQGRRPSASRARGDRPPSGHGELFHHVSAGCSFRNIFVSVRSS